MKKKKKKQNKKYRLALFVYFINNIFSFKNLVYNN